MPSWSNLVEELGKKNNPQEAIRWLNNEQAKSLQEISRLRGNRNVLFYCSSFLQKPQAPAPVTQITHEDLNAFMSCIHGMDCARNLTLVLHTPGGSINAAETIVSYLATKFSDIEVIVPTFAMSAGTMISLASNRIIMGRQSQLGPIDPQFISGAGVFSARSIVDQFEQAKNDILANVQTAHLWAPILQSIGPALLQEAQNALVYGERMVALWLKQRMFKNMTDPESLAKATAAHFNDASSHKSHGRRIDRDEAKLHNVVVEDLEANQDLQDQALTAYHLATIAIERGPAAKVVTTDSGKVWLKNWAPSP